RAGRRPGEARRRLLHGEWDCRGDGGQIGAIAWREGDGENVHAGREERPGRRRIREGPWDRGRGIELRSAQGRTKTDRGRGRPGEARRRLLHGERHRRSGGSQISAIAWREGDGEGVRAGREERPGRRRIREGPWDRGRGIELRSAQGRTKTDRG